MRPRWLPAFAAMACAISVAIGAYASHAAEPQQRERLALAALFAFANALGLIILASRDSALAGAGKTCLALGIIVFSGSLALAGLFSTTTAAAPYGGSLLILGWLLLALDFLRKP